MKEGKNIIELKPGRKMKISPPVFTGCRHNVMMADTHNKVMECERCGFIKTPWEYVYELAMNETNVHGHLENAKAETSRIRNVLADLKRKIRNAKAQKRHLEKVIACIATDKGE